MKKPPSKVAQKYSIFFSPIAAKTAQTEEFIVQNVAYRPTVYRTGAEGRDKFTWTKLFPTSILAEFTAYDTECLYETVIKVIRLTSYKIDINA